VGCAGVKTFRIQFFSGGKIMRSIISLFIPFVFAGLLNQREAIAISPGEVPESELQTPALKLAEFSRLFPQQKAYIHTDKSDYFPGEKVWLKAYLVSALTHIPDTSSTNLFVEFINTRNEVVDFIIFRLKGGFSDGFIQLPDSLPGGNYQIKAYTNWMNNFSKDFFFHKNIFVHNLDEKNYITRNEIRRNERFNSTLNQKQENMQFAFFPEGGNLVAGLENRVAFKAADGLGAGQEASGAIFDSRGSKVLDFETIHDGMGVFSFTPASMEKYSAQIVFKNGQKVSNDLPSALSEGYLLRLEQGSDSILVSVTANFDPENFNMPSDISILAHTRGQVVYVEEGKIQNRVFKTSVPVRTFPLGIAHFTLFGPFETPLAERLVFLNLTQAEEDGPSIAFEKNIGDSLVVVDFWFEPGSDLSPSDASYSLSVTEGNDAQDDQDLNIATYLLLSSDFGISVRDPWYYLARNTPQRIKALDLLMMTHGWRRFVWDDLLVGKNPEIKFSEQKGLSIAGQVTPISSARETGELNLEMSVGYAEKRDILRTRTDNLGRFAFTGLDYQDVFSAMINVERDMRGRIYKVELSGSKKITADFRLGFDAREHTTLERGFNWQRRERPGFFQRILKKDNAGQEMKSPSMFGIPDQVIFIEDLRVNYSNVFDILRDRVTGLHIVGGEITLRGPSSFQLSNEPLFFIDDVQVSRFSFLNLPVSELERIEVLRGPSTAILGSRGANGALLIYTRKAIHQQQYSYEYELRGYHVPREFFISRISMSKYADNQIPRTILWAPNIIPDINGRVRVRIPYFNGGEELRIRLEGIDQKGQITFLQF
jgi:hypothetical protein